MPPTMLACLLCLKSTKVVPDQGPGPSCEDPVTLGLLILFFFLVSKVLVCSDHSFRVNYCPITIHIALLFSLYNSIHC